MGSTGYSRHARRFCFGALALGDVVVGFEDQDSPSVLHRLVAALGSGAALHLLQLLTVLRSCIRSAGSMGWTERSSLWRLVLAPPA